MHGPIKQWALAFVSRQFGLDSSTLVAQIDSCSLNEWCVTVWIGRNLKQRVVVALDGSVHMPGTNGSEVSIIR